MIKIGLVGCGKIGKRHLEAYQGIPKAQVVAISDANKETAINLSRDFGIPYWFTKQQDLLANHQVDAVDVCVPTIEHHKLILDALAKDKHVFCEKPLTYKHAFAKQIQKSQEASGKIVMVGYLYRHHPSFIRLKQVLEDEIIGKPVFAYFRVGARGGHTRWKHQKNGGGAMLEALVHCLDLAYYCFKSFSMVDPLYVETIRKERTINGKKRVVTAEDFALIHLQTKEGVEVFCQSDQLTPSYMNTVEVHGDNGSFFGSILSYLPTLIYCNEGRGQYFKGKNLFTVPEVNLMRQELHTFVDILEKKRNPNNSVATSIEIMKIIEKACEHRK